MLKIVTRDILNSLRSRINESKRKIKQNEEDTVYQHNVIKESEELIRRLER